MPIEGDNPSLSDVQDRPELSDPTTDETAVLPPLLDTLTEVVFRTDPEGRWTYLNRAWTTLTGFSTADSLGSHFLDYVHPDEREPTVALFMAVIAGGAAHCHHQTRYRRRDGTYRWVQLRATVLRRSDGEVIGNAGTILDITDSRLAAEAVGEDAVLLELVAQGTKPDELPVGVAVYDHDLRLRQGSKVIDRMVGLEHDAGDTIERLFPVLGPAGGEGRPLGGDWGLVPVALRTGRPQLGDLEVVPRITAPRPGDARPGDGPRPAGESRRALRASVIPFVTPDEDLLALVLHDVSDLRRFERQQGALARLGQRALSGRDVDLLIAEATRLVAEMIDTPMCDLFEFSGTTHPGDVGRLTPRATVGGHLETEAMTVRVGARSFVSRVLSGDRPVTLEDLRTGPDSEPWLRDRGVVSTVGVRIGGAERPFGILAAHSVGPRRFTADEADFVQSVANVLAETIERDRTEQAVRYQALHDPLTGLANRTLLHERITRAAKVAAREGGQIAVMMMDIDRFKEINDTLGHDVGDLVLREVAGRVGAAVGDAAVVARLGGDEFAILLPSAPGGAADALAAVTAIRSTLADRMNIGGLPLHVDASFGICLAPDDGRDPGTLLRRADMAMYRAKAEGAGAAVYARDGDSHRRERLELLGGLRDAIAQGQIFLHYQPKIDLQTGRMSGVEALVRWQHPVYGLVEPARFVPFAEQSRLVRPLTKRVLTLALDQARDWWDGGRELPVAVNVSARMLHDADLLLTVMSELERTGMPSRALELELTESAVMLNRRNAFDVITRLREAGIRISVDDFGTGYSSLAYLRDLPVHDLKIDKSFVLNLTAHPRNESIVRSIIELGHNLNLRVIAEGIETAEVCSHLRLLGCDVGQGYYLGRPVTPAGIR